METPIKIPPMKTPFLEIDDGELTIVFEVSGMHPNRVRRKGSKTKIFLKYADFLAGIHEVLLYWAENNPSGSNHEIQPGFKSILRKVNIHAVNNHSPGDVLIELGDSSEEDGLATEDFHNGVETVRRIWLSFGEFVLAMINYFDRSPILYINSDNNLREDISDKLKLLSQKSKQAEEIPA